MNQNKDSRFRYFGFFSLTLAGLCLSITAVTCPAEKFVLSAPDRVEDTALWNREFSEWNFGNSPLLEVGSTAGLYEFHSSVSLIRFDLSGLECDKIEKAVLRLYKPNSFGQRYPVEVQVFEVAEGNAGWHEGSMEAAADPQGASWDFICPNTSWAGGPGLSIENKDYSTPALDVKTAPSDLGIWLEFQIPSEIIQKWLDHPEWNAGLFIKTREQAKLGEHVHFYSSEHHTGNGPQLVLTGTPGPASTSRTSRPYNRRHIFPQEDDAQFLRWLDEANNRYTQWVHEFEMTRQQALQIYYYEVIVRGEFLMPRVRVPMFQVMHETKQLIDEGNETQVREKMKEIRKLLLIWEYIRQTQWYDSGPLAEILNPLQLANLYAKPGIGIFDRIDDGGRNFQILTEAELDQVVNTKLESTRQDMRLSDGQYKTIAARYEDYIRREFHYRAEIRKDLDQLYELIEQKKNDTETLEWVKRVHMDHDLFLYYQSLFNTPRWTLLMEHADAIPLAEMYIQVRQRQHTPERTRRQIDHAAKFNSQSFSAFTGQKIEIVIGNDASVEEETAVKELHHFLGQMYPDTKFQTTTKMPSQGAVIVVGTFDSLPILKTYVKPDTLEGQESFRIRSLPNTRNPHLIIAAKGRRGVLMGVYKLLEKLGCGFYMSYDTVPQKKHFLFEPMDWTDQPLISRRFIFNWHNFLSGCSSWNLEEWQKWIVQSQKMGYNGIMVHAYGNNPMIGYEFKGTYRPVGYLASTKIGRDWATNHVNDIQRMWGGQVFDTSVFGSEASVEGSSQQRTQSARKLMQQVFNFASQRDMDVYFAIDIDTESANPQDLITLLPESARFEVERNWLAIPDTTEGYVCYKTQVEQLLRAYPDIDVLALWCRPGRRNGPWTRLTAERLPPQWQDEYRAELKAHPHLAKHEWSPSMFGLRKVVQAYQRAVEEVGRGDVEIAFGTWLRRDVPPRRPGHCISLPLMDAFLPKNVPIVLLDWDVVRDDSFFEILDRRSEFVDIKSSSGRPLWPVAWAHHDDGQYFGPPYKPFPDFYDRLTQMGADEAFGVIHWMTKPLDLYFKSMSSQVWDQTKNQPLRQTIYRAAEDMAGTEAADEFSEYMNEWIENMPRVARETTSRFMHTVREDGVLESMEDVEKGYQRRMQMLNAIDENKLTLQGQQWRAYFQGLEQFMLDLHTCEHHFQQAIEYRSRGDLDAARKAIADVRPENIIENFAEFSGNGGFSQGEKGLLVSLNTRWLSHYEMLRQMLGVSPVRYNFGPTSHEPMAQSPGLYTFYFDPQHRLWEVLGTAETKYETYTLSASEDAVDSAESEIVETGILSDDKIQLTIEPIMHHEDYAGPRTLAAGKYRLVLLTPTEYDQKKTDQALNLTISTKDTNAHHMQIKNIDADKNCNVFEQEFTLTEPGTVKIELASVSGNSIYLGGLVLSPVESEINPVTLFSHEPND